MKMYKYLFFKALGEASLTCIRNDAACRPIARRCLFAALHEFNHNGSVG